MDQSAFDSEIVFTVIVAAFVFAILVIFIVVFILFYQKRRNEQIAEIKLVKSQVEQAILKATLEIREQTLNYVSSELHDNLGQVASLIKINLHTLNLADAKKAEQKIEDTKELVRLLIADLKGLSVSMNTDRIVHMGITTALKHEVDRLNKTGTFEAELLSNEAGIELDANTTIILYRMVQEILNNSIKHSGATRIQVRVSVTEKIFTLVCSDEGVGFNPDEVRPGTGSGITNLHNRAKLIGAQLTIRSSPKGTAVSIELPL